MRSRSWRRALCVVTVVFLLAGCSKGDALSSSPPTETDGATTTTTDAAASCGDAASSNGSALLDCIGPSLAFIETYASYGSGIVVDGGYVVTNAHVIDPFSSATITFQDGERHEDVPLVGVDLVADIAVLGPIDMDRQPVTFEDPADDEQGSDLYLVGYPAEVASDTPELTISRGILSRFRTADPFGLTYVQTDAAIGAGQSGGALIDGAGRVVGVSGNYYDEFAYALAGPDVSESIESITSGTSSEYRSVPLAEDATTASMHVEQPAIDEGVVVLPFTDVDATVRLSLRSDQVPFLVVLDLFTFEPSFVSQTAVDYSTDIFGSGSEDAPAIDGGTEVEPGVFDIDVPANTYLLAVFGAVSGPADVTLEASAPVQILPDLDQSAALLVGDQVDGVIDYFESSDSFLIDLAEGQAIDVSVHSPTGDMAYSIQAPGQDYLDVEFVDDSNVGLLGFDAADQFVAPAAATYTLRVFSNDGFSRGYRLLVSASGG